MRNSLRFFVHCNVSMVLPLRPLPLERIEISCGSLERVLHQMRTTVEEGTLSSSESAIITEYCTLIAELKIGICTAQLKNGSLMWTNYCKSLIIQVIQHQL